MNTDAILILNFYGSNNNITQSDASPNHDPMHMFLFPESRSWPGSRVPVLAWDDSPFTSMPSSYQVVDRVTLKVVTVFHGCRWWF
jgi:hypothetical protein